MRCPNVQRCAVCKRLLIHKGERSVHESASYLGQCVHNLLPPELTALDVDLGLYRREGPHLFRYFEHKGPTGRLKPGQMEFLRIQSRMIAHQLVCEDAARDLGFRLHPRSGVFVMRGDPFEGNQLGPHLITKVGAHKVEDDEQWVCADEFSILRWMAWLTDCKDVDFLRERLRRRRRQPEAS